jgi:hypothetical protein
MSGGKFTTTFRQRWHWLRIKTTTWDWFKQNLKWARVPEPMTYAIYRLRLRILRCDKKCNGQQR